MIESLAEILLGKILILRSFSHLAEPRIKRRGKSICHLLIRRSTTTSCPERGTSPSLDMPTRRQPILRTYLRNLSCQIARVKGSETIITTPWWEAAAAEATDQLRGEEEQEVDEVKELSLSINSPGRLLRGSGYLRHYHRYTRERGQRERDDLFTRHLICRLAAWMTRDHIALTFVVK